MRNEEFDFILHPDGEIELKTHGVKGKRCLEYLKYFEALLGKARQVDHTSEMYEQEVELELGLELHQKVRK